MNILVITFLMVFGGEIHRSVGFREILDDEDLLELIGDSLMQNVAIKILNKNLTNDLECLQDLADLGRMEEPWTLRMVDAAGKIPHGILRGNKYSIGQYKQCIETSVERDFGRVLRGKQCMTTVRVPTNTRISDGGSDQSLDPLPNLAGLFMDIGYKNIDHIKRLESFATKNSLDFQIGLCLPDSCDAKTINLALDLLISSSNIFMEVKEKSCTVREKLVLSSKEIGAISFLSVIGFFMLCSTVYDIWYQFIQKGPDKDRSQLLTSFSVYTNSQRLFTPSKNPGPLSCLHGIKVMSIFWIVLGHRYLMVLLKMPLANLIDVLKWTQSISSSIIIGSTVSVDTFFLISGLLVSYVFFKSSEEKSLKRLPIFYIHRILRLTPLLGVIILIHTTLMGRYGNGPLKPGFFTEIIQPCTNNWWSTLLYLQNYVGDHICVGHSWYLAVDMQLYFLSPILLYPLLWNYKKGIMWTLFCIAVAQSTSFAIAFVNEWYVGPTRRSFSDTVSFFYDFYIATHTRATPYLMGLLAGYFLQKSFKENNITKVEYKFIKLNCLRKLLVILGWVASLCLMGAVLFGIYPLNQASHQFSHYTDTLYNAFSRTIWSVGVLWVIIACAYGYGGPINWFLSLTIWEILGRLSYALYLTHLTIQLMLVYSTAHLREFHHYQMTYDFLADLVISLAISYLLILGFESPVTTLEKIFFRRDAKKSEKIEPRVDNQIVDGSSNDQSTVQSADISSTQNEDKDPNLFIEESVPQELNADEPQSSTEDSNITKDLYINSCRNLKVAVDVDVTVITKNDNVLVLDQNRIIIESSHL